MKTPKEKAQELVDRFMIMIGDTFVIPIILKTKAKQCALICVDEILKENERINLGGAFPTPLTEYWKEVKQEIQKL
jgi:hypothetical protein